MYSRCEYRHGLRQYERKIETLPPNTPILVLAVSKLSFSGKRERWNGFAHQWVVGITGRNREADESIGLILMVLWLGVSDLCV